jgi:hypothetical protein
MRHFEDNSSQDFEQTAQEIEHTAQETAYKEMLANAHRLRSQAVQSLQHIQGVTAVIVACAFVPPMPKELEPAMIWDFIQQPGLLCLGTLPWAAGVCQSRNAAST